MAAPPGASSAPTRTPAPTTTRDSNRAKKRDYVARNRDELNAKAAKRARQWRVDNPERAREKAAKGYKQLRATRPDYHRDRYWRDADKERERLRISMRKSRLADPQRDRETRQRYRQRNAELVRQREREKTYSRRAKQPYSKELAALMANLIQQSCVYCGAAANITIDHIVPLSRGGKHEVSNLAPACLPCNASKCDRLLSEWRGR